MIAQTLLELEQRFRAISCETQVIQGIWENKGQTYRDELVRVFVDVADNQANRRFFVRYKKQLKKRFQQPSDTIALNVVQANQMGVEAGQGCNGMNALQGIIRNGQVVLDKPAELPEGTRVEVLPIEGAKPSLGMREEDWPTTPEGIAVLLARMDQVEPGWLSPEDDAAWRASLRAQKESEKAQFSDDVDKLRRMWE